MRFACYYLPLAFLYYLRSIENHIIDNFSVLFRLERYKLKNEDLENFLNFNKVLSGDLSHAIDLLNREEIDVGVSARIYIRAYASWVEGTLWTFKEMIRKVEYQWHRALPIESQLYLFEYDWFINNGRPIMRAKKISTEENLKAFFHVMRQIFPGYSVDFGGGGWSSVKYLYEIRDRMMHPKFLSDIERSKDDVLKCEDGRRWLMEKFKELFSFIKQRVDLEESRCDESC